MDDIAGITSNNSKNMSELSPSLIKKYYWMSEYLGLNRNVYQHLGGNYVLSLNTIPWKYVPMVDLLFHGNACIGEFTFCNLLRVDQLTLTLPMSLLGSSATNIII